MITALGTRQLEHLYVVREPCRCSVRSYVHSRERRYPVCIQPESMLGRTSHAALSRVLQWHTDGVRATGDSGASVGMVTLTREEIDSGNSGAPYLSPDQRAAVGPLPPFSRNFQSPAHGDRHTAPQSTAAGR